MKILPTGLPTRYRNKRLTPEERLSNLLNIYGVPNSYKLTFTYIDYYRTKSLFSLINLVKLLTNYGTAYCCSALAVVLARSAQREESDLSLLYPGVDRSSLIRAYPNAPGKLYPLSELSIYFESGSLSKLDNITAWFEYPSFPNPATYIKDPILLTTWLEEPYKSYFADLTPSSFFRVNLQRFAGFNTSAELENMLEGIFT
jgi:hypothetical protein